MTRQPLANAPTVSRGRSTDRSCKSAVLAATIIGLLGATEAAAQQICKPNLAVTQTRFSEPQAPALGRLWLAVVAVEASGCAANPSGHFEIVFSRLKENGPELDFRERFVWRPSSVTIGVDFWADEAVERYRIDAVTPCPCPD